MPKTDEQLLRGHV